MTIAQEMYKLAKQAQKSAYFNKEKYALLLSIIEEAAKQGEISIIVKMHNISFQEISTYISALQQDGFFVACKSCEEKDLTQYNTTNDFIHDRELHITWVQQE